jgi:hypothetical protein
MSSKTDITSGEASVDIQFNAPDFPGNDGTFKGKGRRIDRVEVTDDNTGLTQTVPLPANRKCTVKIYTKK